MSCNADELEPPWARFPWIPLGSIGWRMGAGESYLTEWSAHVDTACPDVEAAIVYLQRHPPAPRTWRSWIVSWLDELSGTVPDDEAESPFDRRVDDEELTADDAAYPVFVRNAQRDGGPVVPWARATPHTALRYGARTLGWWARWLAEGCPDRGAYLDVQPSPPEAWATVERSARTGVPAVPHATGGLDALVCTLAATGTLPPPWLAGHEPHGEIEFGDDADDLDRWLWWVTDTFDDAASWRRYLAAWPEAPASWVRAFDEHYLALR